MRYHSQLRSVEFQPPNSPFRELYMKSGQGFLLVFSITSTSSLHELNELREQLVNLKDDPNVPIVLVGNKCDLEEDRAVSRAQAFEVSQSWGNVPYYETSARRKQNVNEVFVDVCRQIIHRDLAKSKNTDGYEREQRRRRRADEDRDHDSESRRKGRGRKRHNNRCTIL